MGYAEEENLVPDQKPPVRLRPNGKQRRLLALVFKEGISFVDAVSQLHIRPRTIAKWLKQPVFIQYMFDSMTKFYVNAQIERLRGVSNAVSSLSSADLSDAQRKAHVDLLRLHKVFSLDSSEMFRPFSDDDGPRYGPFGPLSGHFWPFSGSNGPRCDSFGPSSKQGFPRFSSKNAHPAPFSTQNNTKRGPIESGPKDGPVCDSGPTEPVSPYRHDDPDDPAMAHVEWFQKMFEDWNTAYPDDPDVIAYLKRKKSSELSRPPVDRGVLMPGQKMTDRRASELIASLNPMHHDRVSVGKVRRSNY